MIAVRNCNFAGLGGANTTVLLVVGYCYFCLRICCWLFVSVVLARGQCSPSLFGGVGVGSAFPLLSWRWPAAGRPRRGGAKPFSLRLPSLELQVLGANVLPDGQMSGVVTARGVGEACLSPCFGTAKQKHALAFRSACKTVRFRRFMSAFEFQGR